MNFIPIEKLIQSKYIWLEENHMKTGDPAKISTYSTFLPRISASYGPEGFPLVFQPAEGQLTTEELLEWLKENISEIEKLLDVHGALLFRGFTEALNTPRSFEKVSLIIEPDL